MKQLSAEQMTVINGGQEVSCLDVALLAGFLFGGLFGFLGGVIGGGATYLACMG
ncbi:MAG: hypothetical protein ACYCVH_07175 [Ignavibacteriaceae bacterium]